MDYLQIVAGLVTGFMSGYLATYFTEKAKNKALLEDIKRLTDERRSVESVYELDIAKRKYQYEDKRAQYFRYFNLIDQMNAEQHKMIGDEFLPVLTNYFHEYLAATGDQQQESAVVGKFSANTQTILFKGNEALIRFRGETNALKLIANETVKTLLAKLNEQIDESYNMAGNLVRDMGPMILNQQLELINQRKDEIEEQGNLVKQTHEQLLVAVRDELNEI